MTTAAPEKSTQTTTRPGERAPSANDSRRLSRRRHLYWQVGRLRDIVAELDREADTGEVPPRVRGACASAAVKAAEVRKNAADAVGGLEPDEALTPLMNDLTLVSAALLHAAGSSELDPVGVFRVACAADEVVERLEREAEKLLREAERLEGASVS